MKIYVVTQGEYSDYGIVAICSSLEKAEAYKELFRSYNDIEEYELDAYDPVVEESHGKNFYIVTMDLDGNTLELSEEAYYSSSVPIQFWDNPRNRFRMPVLRIATFATDKVHAVKIANEKRIAFKLEKNL